MKKNMGTFFTVKPPFSFCQERFFGILTLQKCFARAMPQHIVTIGGGTTFETYEAYLQFLRTKPVEKETFLPHSDWKRILSEHFPEAEVFQLQMPNRNNARYREWKIWFERLLPFLEEDAILIGHSLGGIFLAKYLSENDLSVPLKATILVAAPFEGTPDESLGDFILEEEKLLHFSQQSPQIFLFHSTDDPVVPFDHAKRYLQYLPQATLITLREQGHCNSEHFPELFALLRALLGNSLPSSQPLLNS